MSTLNPISMKHYSDDEANQISNEACDLANAIRTNDPELARKIDPWTDIETFPDAGPECDELCRRLQDEIYSFWSLPEVKQRRLLGGWKPCRKQPSAERVARANFTSRVARVLEINVFRGTVKSGQSFVNSDDYEIVVHIPEGTSRQAAMEALSKIIKAIDKDFDTMVDAIPDPTIYNGDFDVK